MDAKIKQALTEAAKDISPREDLLYSIKNLSEKEITMKKIKPVRVILACVLACAALTAGVIGAGKAVMLESHSSLLEEIHHYPTLEELGKSIDFAPVYPEKLGSYEFKSCVPTHNADIDENGSKLAEYTGMSFMYNTEKGHLNLSVEPRAANIADYTEIVDYNGLKLYYHSILYKFVPPDYELTDEDKAMNEKGELEISYGSDKVELMNTQSVLWDMDGLCYCLLDMDAGIDKADFIGMAEQITDMR